jgi:galactose-1-phosphate uridylyltransferase
MSAEHYVPLGAFTEEVLSDAFGVALDYFRALASHPRTTYCLAFWNYLPASGGTQIHPHLQLSATETPGNALEHELEASQRYAAEYGHPYWLDLIQAEEEAGERFVGRGAHSVWITDFVSQSLLADIDVLFPETHTLLELSTDALAEFCRGLGNVLRQFEAQGIYSFNLAWFSATSLRDDFWLHARVSPRVYMTPRLWGADTSALQHLYQEHFMVQTPEAAAQLLRGSLQL